MGGVGQEMRSGDRGCGPLWAEPGECGVDGPGRDGHATLRVGGLVGNIAGTFCRSKGRNWRVVGQFEWGEGSECGGSWQWMLLPPLWVESGPSFFPATSF